MSDVMTQGAASGRVPLPTLRPTGQEDVVRELRPAASRVSVSEFWRGWPVARIVAIRDLKVRYKQSILGPAWLVLQPLGVLMGLVLVFRGVTTVDTDGVPYLLFSLASLSAWTFVQLAISLGTNVFLINNVLLRRVAFPRTALFTAVLLGNFVPTVVILVLAVIGAATTGWLHLQVLLLPVVAVWMLALMGGVVMATASLTVRYRDVFALVPFWLQVGLFLTPVGYPLSSAPENLETALALNPISGIIELWRWCLFGTPVGALPLICSAVGTVVALWGGWRIFTRMEGSFADVI